MNKLIPINLLTLIIFAVGASACSLVRTNPNGSAPTPSTNASPGVLSTPVAAPERVESNLDKTTPPEALVKELYDLHDKQKGPFIKKGDRAMLDKFFTKELADLLWKEEKNTTGEIGAIDFDPLYNTQDEVDVKSFSIKPGAIKGDTATVTVGFVDADRKQIITFSMKKENGSWKIADIKYPESDGILKMLKDTYPGK